MWDEFGSASEQQQALSGMELRCAYLPSCQFSNLPINKLDILWIQVKAAGRLHRYVTCRMLIESSPSSVMPNVRSPLRWLSDNSINRRPTV
ncbi:hypothetical protein D3OALGA1CA_2252 [Olavius algarvensis associated proteobacterium Delta 3]|nr:hypothetical protein D3OALGA1CA_2252 [Olavius algarvensis associated proteobacterium Delta 3]CAB5165623.1 hypothetical protein D3OALGB2SA_5731 [Olavius algarvensis associated proteobacterium Delta 3]